MFYRPCGRFMFQVKPSAPCGAGGHERLENVSGTACGHGTSKEKTDDVG